MSSQRIALKIQLRSKVVINTSIKYQINNILSYKLSHHNNLLINIKLIYDKSNLDNKTKYKSQKLIFKAKFNL